MEPATEAILYTQLAKGGTKTPGNWGHKTRHGRAANR